MLEEGQLVAGKYQVGPFLGEGGMGAVYEAVHVGTRRRVAIKVIIHKEAANNRTLVARFQREAVAAGTVDTQHIVQILDTGFDDDRGTPFMVMELLAGEDLAKLLQRLSPLPPELALRIVGQACVGLQKAHEASVIHRDIKSANLFLAERDGGELIVKLLDFGIAKIRDDSVSAAAGAMSLTRTGSVLGSPLYMSPEQAMGAKTVDHRADVWSLGVVLYEALTGRTPHQQYDTFGRLIIAICQEPTTPVQDLAPWVRPEIAAIAHKALRIRPEDRFASAEVMLAAIRTALGGSLTIERTMIDAVTAEERAVIRPRLVITGDESRKVSAFASTVSSDEAMVGATAGGVSTTMKPRRRTAPVVIGAAILAVGVAALGIARWSRSETSLPPSARTSAAIVAPSSADAPPVVAPASASPPAPTVASVRVQIAPIDATVEIDGAPADARGGSVALGGALGSVHHVRVRDGAREAVADVVITQQGAIPARITVPEATPHATKHGGSSRPPRPAVAREPGTKEPAAKEPGAKPGSSLGTTDSFQ
jgi:serine/threonine-protein kinase